MKYLKFVPLALALTGLSLWPMAKWCTYVATNCFASQFFDPLFSIFIKPFYFYSQFALIPVIMLIFVRKEIFMIWLKFAAVWIPLSILLISTSDTSNMTFYVSNTESTTQLLGIGFLGISLLIMGWGTYKEKRRK